MKRLKTIKLHKMSNALVILIANQSTLYIIPRSYDPFRVRVRGDNR